MSKPSLTNCPKLAAAPAARGVPAQSWYNERCMNEDVPLQQELQPLLLARKFCKFSLCCPNDILVVIALGITSSHSEQRS